MKTAIALMCLLCLATVPRAAVPELSADQQDQCDEQGGCVYISIQRLQELIQEAAGNCMGVA